MSPLTRSLWQAFSQNVQQIDEELLRSLLLNQLGASTDPGCIFHQPWEGADAGVDWVDEHSLDDLRR